MFGFSACSSDEQAPYATQLADVLPLGGEITGWDEDTSRGEAGHESATDVAMGKNLINGAIVSIDEIGSWDGLVLEYYQNANNTKISAFVVEMSTRSLGAKAYDEMFEYNPNFDWANTSFGGGEDQGRAGPDIEEWYADIQKGRYFLQFAAKPKAEVDSAKSFITAVLNRIQ